MAMAIGDRNEIDARVSTIRRLLSELQDEIHDAIRDVDGTSYTATRNAWQEVENVVYHADTWLNAVRNAASDDEAARSNDSECESNDEREYRATTARSYR